MIDFKRHAGLQFRAATIAATMTGSCANRRLIRIGILVFLTPRFPRAYEGKASPRYFNKAYARDLRNMSSSASEIKLSKATRSRSQFARLIFLKQRTEPVLL